MEEEKDKENFEKPKIYPPWRAQKVLAVSNGEGEAFPTLGKI